MKRIIIPITIIGFFFLISCERNKAPEINSITNLSEVIVGGSEVILSVNVTDDSESLTYDWYSNGGTFKTNTSSVSVVWIAPAAISDKSYTITVKVSDEEFTSQADHNISVEGGKFIDNRDENIYGFVKIGDQFWMAENLGWDAGNNCWTYNDDELNYISMGRLYTWEAALHACPSGWHLPSDLEWEELAYFISQDKGPYSKVEGGDDWENLSIHLKSAAGWKNDANGTDDYGFAGSPTGGRSYNNDYFHHGEYVYWWSATSANENNSWFRYMSYYNQYFLRDFLKKIYAFSVRCIKD